MDYSERIHNRLAAHPGKVRGDCAAIAGEADCEIAALRFALDEVRKEAARYRWLRAQNWNDGLLAVVADPKDAIKLGYDCPSLDRLDEQIDAAMLAQRAVGAA